MGFGAYVSLVINVLTLSPEDDRVIIYLSSSTRQAVIAAHDFMSLRGCLMGREERVMSCMMGEIQLSSINTEGIQRTTVTCCITSSGRDHMHRASCSRQPPS